jgi:hypothetical protein
MLGVYTQLAVRSYNTSQVTFKELSSTDINRNYLNSLSENQLDDLIISDKRVFIFYSFLLDHINTLVENYSQLEYLLEQKHSLQSWRQEILEKWSLLNDIPDWLMGSPKLRDLWLSKYQRSLQQLRLDENKTMKANNEAKRIYEAAVERNNRELLDKQTALYEEEPVILIHRITPGALSETDLIKLHSLNKEQRKLKRKELVKQYRINLLEDYNTGKLSKEELIELVK